MKKTDVICVILIVSTFVFQYGYLGYVSSLLEASAIEYGRFSSETLPYHIQFANIQLYGGLLQIVIIILIGVVWGTISEKQVSLECMGRR